MVSFIYGLCCVVNCFTNGVLHTVCVCGQTASQMVSYIPFVFCGQTVSQMVLYIQVVFCVQSVSQMVSYIRVVFCGKLYHKWCLIYGLCFVGKLYHKWCLIYGLCFVGKLNHKWCLIYGLCLRANCLTNGVLYKVCVLRAITTCTAVVACRCLCGLNLLRVQPTTATLRLRPHCTVWATRGGLA